MLLETVDNLNFTVSFSSAFDLFWFIVYDPNILFLFFSIELHVCRKPSPVLCGIRQGIKILFYLEKFRGKRKDFMSFQNMFFSFSMFILIITHIAFWQAYFVIIFCSFVPDFKMCFKIPKFWWIRLRELQFSVFPLANYVT